MFIKFHTELRFGKFKTLIKFQNEKKSINKAVFGSVLSLKSYNH